MLRCSRPSDYKSIQYWCPRISSDSHRVERQMVKYILYISITNAIKHLSCRLCAIYILLNNHIQKVVKDNSMTDVEVNAMQHGHATQQFYHVDHFIPSAGLQHSSCVWWPPSGTQQRSLRREPEPVTFVVQSDQVPHVAQTHGPVVYQYAFITSLNDYLYVIV